MLARRWPELLWGLFAAANVAVMVVLHEWQTVPFHLIWVSLTLLYGFRLWRPASTSVVLVAVSILTGLALTRAAITNGEELDELTEVPLMGAMFLAMVWHARRRHDALVELGRAAERQRDFVRDASHELRTPITVARGHAELAQASVPGAQPTEDLQVIVDELDRLKRISDRLLTLAVAEDRVYLVRAPVDVDRLVGSLERRWSGVAERAWQFRSDVGGNLDGDEEHLVGALDALIENAVKATGPGDRIGVTARAEGAAAVIEVSDTGRGIDPDELPGVFERFRRLDAARARHDGGTGLGLAIVRAIVESHGGSVTAASEPGSGTTFRIRLEGLALSPA